MIRLALFALLQATPEAGMPAWLPIAIMVAGFLFTVLFGWYFFFGGEDEEDEDTARPSVGDDTLAITADGLHDTLLTTAEEFKSTARKSRMIALKESLERSLDSRESGQKLSAKDRMLMPWFLLVGADGSGKKTILGNTGLPLPWGPPLEVDSQRKDAGKWWLFDDAVVLEAPAASPGTTAGAQTLPPGQTVADTSVGWNTLLHMLRRERPDSPLNGIIVTISCADLIGARNNPERMEEQADRIRNFLERTRKLLGVRLPLHVLVTKCDALPGFKSFADALPESRRHDIFGWANDSDPESRFEPGWVDEGFAHLQGQLTTLRDEVLAAPEHVRDSVGVFVFDAEFSDLQEPLKAFVARLMTIGERRPSLFFRGFYFTGDALDTSAPADDSDAGDTLSEKKPRKTTRISSEIAGDPHNLVFLRSLFSEKIFKEAGLARPTARLRLSRDRRVVAAQAAALLLALIGGTGLYTSINGFTREEQVVTPGLRADSDALMRVLSGLAIDLDDIKHGDRIGEGSPLDRRARDAAVIELVAQMRDVPSMQVRSAFIPSSWFSPLPGEIRSSMMAGVQSLVLPVTRQRLQERAERLLGPREAADSLVPDELDPSDPRSLMTYLEDVRVLSRNIQRYNSLADSTSGSVAELSALLDYLFGEQIGVSDSAMVRADFEAALTLASAPKITLSPQMTQTVVARAVAMVDQVAMTSARQLQPAANARAEAAVRPEEDLEALRGLAELVELVDVRKGVVATVSDSAILGARLARVVEDSVRAAIDRAATTIARDTLGPVDAGNRLRTVIGRLFQYRLMARSEGRRVVSELRPSERLRWDVGNLELALALQGEFLQAVVTVADAFPGQSPERMRRALDVQLRARTLDVAAAAQRFTPLEPNANLLVESKQAGQNLYDATSRLTRLAALLDSMRAGPDGRRLLVAGTRQAENALANAWTQFERLNSTLVPQTARVASWQGITPLSYPSVGANTVLDRDAAILRHTADMRAMVDAVGNSIRFLRQTAPVDSIRAGKLLTDWETVVVSVQRYDRGEATSTLGALYRFLRESMEMMDLASCTAAAAIPDTVRPSPDIFAIRRRQFHAAMVSRCGTGGGSEAIAAYQRLRTLFQTRLAGHYPFSDSTYALAGDADPRDVRTFVQQLDTFMLVHDVTLRSHPTLSQTTRPAATFIDQAVATRPFLASFAEEGASRTVPTYSMLVAAPASDSLPMALLELQVGSRQNTIEETALEHAWRAGDSVKVILTPFDTAASRTLYAAGGTWAALRFAQSRPAGVTVRFFEPDTKLERALPAFPSSAPDLLGAQTRPAPPSVTSAGQPAAVTKAPPAPAPATKAQGKAPRPTTKAKTPPRSTKAKTPPARSTKAKTGGKRP